MSSLWPVFSNEEKETNNAITILRNQAKAIKQETNGAVCATFSKMNYKQGPIDTMSNFVTIMSSTGKEEVLDDELKNKKDINILYNGMNYKFEIYNSEYRFRLFVVKYSIDYPITLHIDEGIAEKIEYTNDSPISSNEELEKILKQIFSSPKVYSVVTKMIKYENQKKEQEK